MTDIYTEFFKTIFKVIHTCYFTNFKYIFKNITLYHKSCDTSAFLNGMHSFNINYDQLDINNANSEVYNT